LFLCSISAFIFIYYRSSLEELEFEGGAEGRLGADGGE
tara:strand:- start:1 stop:114 length:114 start_codon:yes stop_codon:yes gene_type:complete